MRFYLDADLSWRVARLARRRGLDVIAAQEVGRRIASDAEQLIYATQQNRCLVTNNRDDFLALDRGYRELGLTHAGVLITAESLPTDDFSAVAGALAHYDSLHAEDFIPGLIDYLHPAPADQ